MPAVIRPFAPADAEAIAALCHANSRDVVTDPAADGFVQGDLPAAAITRMAADGGVFVAEHDGRLAGFVRSGLPRCPAGPSPASRLVELAPALDFRGWPVGEAGWIVYGPIVIDAAYRGQGITRALLAAVRGRWQGLARVGVLFIEQANQHSIDVHLHGLGMEHIGGYTFGGRAYLIAAFAI